MLSRNAHFSMVRTFHLADLFTLGNAGSGVAAILCLMFYMDLPTTGYFAAAIILILAALVFDVLDGRIARWRHSHSAFGRELDSLADVISFGVAPAALGFAAGMRGSLDCIVLIYFVCCGVSRLARFNITAESLSAGGDKVSHFEGTPIPTSVLLTLFLAFAAWKARIGADLYFGSWSAGAWVLHPFSLLYALSGTLMVSKTLRILKF